MQQTHEELTPETQALCFHYGDDLTFQPELIIVIKIKWLGNFAAFFVLCFCPLLPYCYMTLTLHRLQKALRCK